MTLTLHTFAAANELLGSPVQVEVDDHATVKDLRDALLATYPALGGLASFAIARNEEYALLSDPVTTTDTLVIIPPVAGG